MSGERPRIVVVVPCRNERATILACIESVRRQVPAPTCVVVVDNGSTDGSHAAAGSLADLVLSDDSATIARLRNLGVSAAGDCDVVAFLDADCTAEPGWLAAGLAALEDADVAGARTRAPESGTWVGRRWAAVEERLSGTTGYVGSANMIVRAASFSGVGGFNESLRTSEDVDLCRRVAASGGRIAVVPAMRVVHHGTIRTLAAFVRRQLWHASAPGWWWRASGRARSLVACTLVWLALGLVVVFVGLTMSVWWPLAAWALASALAVPILGYTAGARSTAPADGVLLALWALSHAVRVSAGRTRTRGGHGVREEP